jgi:importin-5
LMQRGRPWCALQAQAFSVTQSQNAGLRESMSRVCAGSGMLVMNPQPDAVLNVLKGGLEDTDQCKSQDLTANHFSSVLTDMFPH